MEHLAGALEQGGKCVLAKRSGSENRFKKNMLLNQDE